MSRLIDILKEGNKIHIKKANRGKFTDYCGGKVTNECIQRGKNSPDPKIRRRATFAANARTWKHQNGGVIYKPFIPDMSFDDTFRVEEPVRITFSALPEPKKIFEGLQEQTTTPVVEEEQPVVKQEGKVYTSKDGFKQDIYDAYVRQLSNYNLKSGKKLSQKDISDYAKRLATQDILESGWGNSSLSKYYNFGGIKDFSGKGVSAKTTEFENGAYTNTKANFREFSSMDDFAQFKIKLLDNRYNFFNSDPTNSYSTLKRYATDPKYIDKLNTLYNKIWK